MKIDLHTHCREHSACSLLGARELVRQAYRCGLDAVVITDHHHFLTRQLRDELQATTKLRVFRGIEITVVDSHGSGLSEDVLVIGPQELDLPSPLPLAQIELLAEFSQRTGALTVLAHPFRFHEELALDLDLFTPDAVEIASRHMSRRLRRRALALARRRGMRPVVSSDAHHVSALGGHFLDLDEPALDEFALAQAIRAGRYHLRARPTGLHHRKVPGTLLSWGGSVGRFLARA
jgi:predicted metal-dependent phosphoesterase TrpH